MPTVACDDLTGASVTITACKCGSVLASPGQTCDGSIAAGTVTTCTVDDAAESANCNCGNILAKVGQTCAVNGLVTGAATAACPNSGVV